MTEALRKEEAGARPKERDSIYYGRQRLISIMIVNIDPKTRRLVGGESYRQAMDRIGATKYSDFVALDAEGNFDHQLDAQELYAKFGDRVLRPFTDPETGLPSGRNETVEELQRSIDKRGLGIDAKSDNWDALQKREKVLGLQGARIELTGIYAKVDDIEFYIREYERDHETILSLSTAPWEIFKKIIENGKIDRESKIKMWQIRVGDYLRDIAEIQAKVDSGEIAEFGPEYNRLKLAPYQTQTKRLKSELIEMTKWNIPIPGYTKLSTRTSDASVVVGRGTGGEILTSEDLRHTVALWQASSSTAFAEGKSTFGDDEGRALGTWKRKPVVQLRDQWAGIQIILGEEGNENSLPMTGATTDYRSINRALDWAQNEKNEMQKILKSTKSTPEEKASAEDRLELAEMVLQGIKALPEFLGPDGKVLSQEARDKKIRAVKNELRQLTAGAMSKYELEVAEQKRRELIKTGGRLYYLINKLILIEGGYAENEHDPTGIPGYHEGKNAGKEIVGILHRRDLVSPPIVYGLPIENLVALLESGHDPVEKKALWESVLMRRERSFIDQCIVNDNIARAAGWPNSVRLQQIQRERDRYFPQPPEGTEEPLPQNPFKRDDARGEVE